ncbi:MAG: alternative oxidase [Proteobacteria bacterium]|nr:alternative oxidase [Pseudomonadota bacterium]
MKSRFKPSSLITHRKPRCISDYIAYRFIKILRAMADFFFVGRYGHRAVVLETVAGVPGIVGGMLQHLKSLRRCCDDHGWIKVLLDEAENERMHLMTFIELAHPSWLERMIIVLVQIIFFCAYFILYLFSPKTAHRFVGYLEEEAVISYTQYIEEVKTGKIDNVPAPEIAITYWKLPKEARLYDLLIVVREDEAHHRDTNHEFSDALTSK